MARSRFLTALAASVLGLSLGAGATAPALADLAPRAGAEAAYQTVQETEEAPETEPRMTPEALMALIGDIDPDAQLEDSGAAFTVGDRQMVLVYDADADRMRMLTAIAPADVLTDGLAIRLLQANYDTVLDVRYAVAQNIVWSVFLHPLSSLTETDFLSALAQTVTAAQTFGTTFTSGALAFGGGDSAEQNRQLLEELQRRLQGSEI